MAPDLESMRPTWAEIDLAAFERNVAAVAGMLPQGSRLIAVLKADAYGHGAVELARHCRPELVAMIATSLLEEALELRHAGIELPLLILGPIPAEQIPDAAGNDIAIGVVGPEELADVAAFAKTRDVTVHLKLDSGMGRMGITEGDLSAAVDMLRAAPRVRVAGIYTHFADADDPSDPHTDAQIRTFGRLVQLLRERGIDPQLHHLANSAATMRHVVTPGDWVRVGISLYGGEPLVDGHSRLEPLMRWRTEIARLKTLPAGSPVGYGSTFRTTRPSMIATLPVGYADGYNRGLSNRGEALVRGRRAPVVGRVSMDLVTLDVTDIHDVAVGDEVVLLGSQGPETISAEEIAERIGTISYEVFCAVSARVPRVYRSGRDVFVRSRFDRYDARLVTGSER
ncbi:MAG: alanine racemase [Thermoanaerobaculia bacterium]